MSSITVTGADGLSQKQVVDGYRAKHARELAGKTVRVSRVVRTGDTISYRLVIHHADLTNPPKPKRGGR